MNTSYIKDPDNILRLLKLFLSSREGIISPFNCGEIVKWCISYCERNGEEVPYILSNGRSLGKYLANNLQNLPLEYAGNYGNKAFYKGKK